VFAKVSILQTLYEDGSVEIEWCNWLPEHRRVLQRLGLRLIDLPERLEPFP